MDNRITPGREDDLDELILTLTCSFYLNLSRNKSNTSFLIGLDLFQQMRELSSLLVFNDDCVQYTNAMFQKLIANHQVESSNELKSVLEFYESILKMPKKRLSLFQETLNSVKMLLSEQQNIP